jgi:hypothetical protein
MLNKRDMVGTFRSLHKFHPGLFRSPVALDVVAPDAGTNQILPAILPAVDFGDDVIDSHLSVILSTILADVIVPFDYVFSG